MSICFLCCRVSAGEWDSNPRSPKARDLESLIEEFIEFCLVDLDLARTTTNIHVRELHRFFDSCANQPIDRVQIRRYLLRYKDNHSAKRKALSALKRFFRDYLNRQELVNTFKFPSTFYMVKIIPSHTMMTQFFKTLPDDDAKTIFLFYASSGLRRNEAINLQIIHVDFDKRMILPPKNNSRTKRTWVTFYNAECEEYLNQYLKRRNQTDSRLFQFAHRTVNGWFEKTKKKTGVRINPQRLREWFCCEMGRLGTPDRYVDAFCGRIPRSVLARHYTDFSPETLKEIYDKTNLKVLL